jgi:two-component system, LytTR family, response regulator
MTDAIRTVLVDDEALALARLRRLLEPEADVAIIAECTSGRAAIEAVETLRPELLFLDVQMPEVDGFGVLDGIAATSMPFVVFVTAFDAHAVRAFEVCAVDYLLKPIDAERVQQTVARVRAARDQATAAQRYATLRAIVEDVRPHRGVGRLLIREDGRVRPVRTSEIDWIDAIGNYARLHVHGRTHMMRMSLRAVEQALDPDRFCRVHRSLVINIERLAELQPHGSGDSIAVLSDGARLRVSRRYREELERRLRS